MTAPLFINGKFYAVPMTGVHRVAEELLRALDDLLGAPDAPDLPPLEILSPAKTLRRPDFKKISADKPGALTRNAWEQVELPWRARGGRLLNLCNIGPLANQGAITMIHDAQMFLSPDSHSRAFIAWYKFAIPTLARNSACVLTVSDFSRRMLAEHQVAPLEKIVVIPNGVDHILRAQSDSAALARLSLVPERYVLALANTQAHKNIGVLFQAFSALTLNDLRLVLIGGATKEDFGASGLAAPDNVIFAGRLADGEMRALMEQALCFACPSTTEGFGLPPLEAMRLGCPAIVAPCGALPEVCGAAALYADPRDGAAWAAAIEKLAAQPKERGDLAAAGIEHARQFTWARSADLLVDVIKQYSA